MLKFTPVFEGVQFLEPIIWRVGQIALVICGLVLLILQVKTDGPINIFGAPRASTSVLFMVSCVSCVLLAPKDHRFASAGVVLACVTYIVCVLFLELVVSTRSSSRELEWVCTPWLFLCLPDLQTLNRYLDISHCVLVSRL